VIRITDSLVTLEIFRVTGLKYLYSAPSPFAGVTFFKIPASGKTAMGEVKNLWEKWGYWEPKMYN
jgi:hypothetical protein